MRLKGYFLSILAKTILGFARWTQTQNGNKLEWALTSRPSFEGTAFNARHEHDKWNKEFNHILEQSQECIPESNIFILGPE